MNGLFVRPITAGGFPAKPSLQAFPVGSAFGRVLDDKSKRGRSSDNTKARGCAGILPCMGGLAKQSEYEVEAQPRSLNGLWTDPCYRITRTWRCDSSPQLFWRDHHIDVDHLIRTIDRAALVFLNQA